MFTLGRIVAIAAALSPSSAEIISDLTTSSIDEGKAREIKKDQFWQPLLDAAERMHVPEHLRLCSEAEARIAQLPAENEYVRSALSEVVMRLRRANEALLRQAVASSQVAEGKLAGPVGSGSGGSFLSGEDLFSRAVRHFVGERAYSDRLAKDVADRQTDVLPVLQGAAGMTSSVLEDSRLASKRSFDVLKYDIYNKGVPKTPKDAKDLAEALIDAAGKTRRQFTSFITTMVGEITRDFQGRKDSAATTVVQSALKKSLLSSSQSTDSSEQLINL